MTNALKDIDLVYMWVNGNDPEWQKKHQKFANRTSTDPSILCKGRYAENDELKYSIRSIELYAPWIRKIFIVTDHQTPEWIDLSNPKIRIVDHSEIMPAESLPCFNSSVIEHFLHKIPGLSEHFLFSNDDMFLNRPVSPQDFFTPEGYPIVRLKRKPFRRIRWWYRDKVSKRPLMNYRKMIVHSSELVNKLYGVYYNGLPHHNIDAYLKSLYQQTMEVTLHDEVQANNKNRLRSDEDIHRSVITYLSLAEKKGRKRYVTDKESMILKIHREDHYDFLKKYNPMFFCMNDSENAKDSDREAAKIFLKERFPEKSSFEK